MVDSKKSMTVNFHPYNIGIITYLFVIATTSWRNFLRFLSNCLLFLSIVSCSHTIEERLPFPYEIQEYQNRKPVKHAGYYDPLTQSGKWLNYLVLDLPYEPVQLLRKKIEGLIKVDLSETEKKRGKEAHITIITPVEYWNLHSHLKMQKINQLFLNRVQALSFEPICIGKGSINEDKLSTFYIVIKSDEIIELRKEIQKIFIQNGGSPTAFQPENYFPHITIGFNQRDLHLSDGVKKDQRSCYINFNNIKEEK